MNRSSALILLALWLGLLSACTGFLPAPTQANDTNLIATSVAATLSAISSSSNQPIPTQTPTVPNIITNTPVSGWETYVDSKYGFSFQHPPYSQTCCRISLDLTGQGEFIIVLADESTVVPNTDRYFNGFSIYVVQNAEDITLQQYVEQEKAAQIQASKAQLGEAFVLSGSERTVTIGGQTGIEIQGYSWISIHQIYAPFPHQKLFLVIGMTEQSEGSFEPIFSQILSTFTFTK